MLKPELSSQFKRDYNLLIRRGYDISKLDTVVVIEKSNREGYNNEINNIGGDENVKS